MNKKILYTLILFLTTNINNADCQVNKILCQDIMINSEIRYISNNNDSTFNKIVNYEIWHEYNDNRNQDAAIFPDSFFVYTYMFDAAYFLGSENKIISPFKTIVKVSLKYSITDICTDPINLKITREYIIGEYIINHNRFMRDTNEFGAQKSLFISNPFNLKKVLKDYHIDGKNYYLNQIIVKTYMFKMNCKKPICISEFIQPVCVRKYKYD